MFRNQNKYGDPDADDDDYRRRQLSGPGHQPTRPVDKEKAEAELMQSIKKAVSADETAPSEYLIETDRWLSVCWEGIVCTSLGGSADRTQHTSLDDC